jgi:hypothetical protein
MNTVKGAAVFLLGASLLASGAEPDSKALGQCPYGHKTLKDIPILYELPPSGGPELKKYNEKLAAGEFVSGFNNNGDADPPRIQVTCTTCGFDHIQRSPDFGEWGRSNLYLKSFQIPFTELLTTFPTPPAKKLRREVYYNQHIDDKLNFYAEALTYSSAESLDRLRGRIDAWLKGHHIVAKTKTAHVKASERISGALYGVTWDSWLPNDENVTAYVTFEQKDGRCYVHFMHLRGPFATALQSAPESPPRPSVPPRSR